MEWKTLKYSEPIQEPVEDKPDIEVNIFLGESSLKENLTELFNEIVDENPDEETKRIDETKKKEQVEINNIWNHIGPRIP